MDYNIHNMKNCVYWLWHGVYYGKVLLENFYMDEVFKWKLGSSLNYDLLSCFRSGPIYSGLPQKRARRPALFHARLNLYLNNILRSTKLLAEDLKIYLPLHDPVYECYVLQEGIDAVVKWLKLWLLNVSHQKCQMFHINFGLGGEALILPRLYVILISRST